MTGWQITGAVILAAGGLGFLRMISRDWRTVWVSLSIAAGLILFICLTMGLIMGDLP